MSAQRLLADPSSWNTHPQYLPGGYGSPTPLPTAQAAVIQVTAPAPLSVPRSQSGWVWSLAGLVASLALSGVLQMQLSTAQHRLESVQRDISETQATIAQQRHLVNSAVATRNTLAAQQRTMVRKPMADGALYLPALDHTLGMPVNSKPANQ